MASNFELAVPQAAFSRGSSFCFEAAWCCGEVASEADWKVGEDMAEDVGEKELFKGGRMLFLCWCWVGIITLLRAKVGLARGEMRGEKAPEGEKAVPRRENGGLPIGEKGGELNDP